MSLSFHWANFIKHFTLLQTTKRDRTEWGGSCRDGSIFNKMYDVRRHDVNGHRKCSRPNVVDDVRCSYHHVCFWHLRLFFCLFSATFYAGISTRTNVIDDVKGSNHRACFWLLTLSPLLLSGTSSEMILTGFFYRSMMLLLSLAIVFCL